MCIRDSIATKFYVHMFSDWGGSDERIMFGKLNSQVQDIFVLGSKLNINIVEQH